MVPRFAFLPLLLAACVAAPDVGSPPVPQAMADTCGAAPHSALIGQPATALERVLIMRQVRVIYPDTMVTMDFIPTRINFEIDAAGRIARITCG